MAEIPGFRPATIGSVFRRFVNQHYACGTLTGGSDEPTPRGFRQWLTCSCGATFERWVTSDEDEADESKSGLIG